MGFNSGFKGLKLLRIIQQDTKKHHKKGAPGRKYKKMAESMRGKNKRSCY